MDQVGQHRSLYDLSPAELEGLVRRFRAPRYRADQILHWLYRRFVCSFDDMTNLPRALREQLAEATCLHTLAPMSRSEGDDGLSAKLLFRLADGRLVETVLMHFLDPADADQHEADPVARPGRHTVCLSTQAGCAMGCVFCATGQMGLERDLTPGECIEQLVHCGRLLHRSGRRLTNVVFMGMGEPLANWPATWATLQMLTDTRGFGLSPRRVTISTVGIVPGIRRLARAGLPVRLAVSLHAPDDALRTRLVPINATFSLDAILTACRDYQHRLRRRVTFEYVLIEAVNDRPAQAEHLAARLRGLKAHVNLIPLNPTAGSRLRPGTRHAALAFGRVLQAAGIPTTLRMRRGIDIQAGCGQLRSRAAEGRVGHGVKPPGPAPVSTSRG